MRYNTRDAKLDQHQCPDWAGFRNISRQRREENTEIMSRKREALQNRVLVYGCCCQCLHSLSERITIHVSLVSFHMCARAVDFRAQEKSCTLTGVTPMTHHGRPLLSLSVGLHW